MLYLLLPFLSFIASVKALIQGRFGRQYGKNSQDAVMYNCVMFAATALIFFILYLFSGEGLPSAPTVYLAVVVGACSVAFQFFYTKALGRGSVSLTALINGFYILFPTVLGIAAYGERIVPVQMLGAALFVATMLLTVTPEQRRRNDGKWLAMALACMAASGTVNALQKVHQHTAAHAEYTSFIVLNNIAAFVFSLLIYWIHRARTGERRTAPFTPRVVAPIGLVGLILGLYNMLTLYLSGRLDSVIMYPAINVINMAFTTLWSVTVFKDRLSRRKALALLIGTASIVLIGMG